MDLSTQKSGYCVWAMEMVGNSGLTSAFEKRQACYPCAGRKSKMPHTLINHYRAIELSSTHMLAFATVSDWGAVVDCEQVCSMQIQQLRQQMGAATHQHGMTPEQKAQKRQIMARILAIDAQIRTLAEPATGCDAHQYRQRAIRPV